MPTKYPQYLLSGIIAADGDYTIPPDSQEISGDGHLSILKGWDTETSTPIEQGGVAPFRKDFNGLAYLLSQFILWYQQGGIMNYSSSIDYEVGNEILQNGVKFRCIQANGPASAVKAPGSEPDYWKNMDSNVPAGACLPFCNVTLGGSDGRRPIFWGTTQANEGWVLADGGTGQGDDTVPDLRGKFVKGGNGTDNGKTGGSASTTLTEAYIPAHTHKITINKAGGHTHTRGTMDITGWIGGGGQEMNTQYGGAFYYRGAQNNADDGNTSGVCCNFQASRAWTGETSSNGSHSHTATCTMSSEGQPTAITTEPPFYTLAYFVKLSE